MTVTEGLPEASAPAGAAAAPATTCPSAPAIGSSRLLGIVDPSGRVFYTPGGPRLTETLRMSFGIGAPRMEGRYRFSGACLENGCVFWREGDCAAVAAAHAEFDVAEGPLPECGIRETCRWWAQDGPRACAVCPFVLTVAGP